MLLMPAQEREAEDLRDDAAGLLTVLLENFPGGICLFDADLKMVLHNDELKRLLDYPDDLFWPDRPSMDELFRFNAKRGEYGDGDVEEFVAERMARARKKVAHVYDRVRPDGRILEVRGAPLKCGGFITTYLDVTDQRRRTRELEAIVQNYPGGLVLYDQDLQMVLHNDMFQELLQLPDELFEHGLPRMEDVFRANAERGEYGDGDVEEHVRFRLERAKGREPHQYERKRPDDRILSIRGVPIKDSGFLTTYHDVTEKRRSQELIAHMAHHDALTDLPNRLLLVDRLRLATAQAKRGQGFALHYLDLDKFKPVNDTLGHAAGDELLKAVASRLRLATRDTDTVARLGGDEFVVLQSGAIEETPAEILAARILSVLSRPFEIDGVEVQIGASVGIALSPKHSLDPDELLKMADQALYNVKAAGRNAYSFFAASPQGSVQNS
ncbi:MAG: PAS-domain containing protein [Pseudomonadota bacterium]